jgi:SAM-dependent methyltransferase
VSVVQSNSKVWEDIYSQGKSVLIYPNESMVRLSYGLLNPESHKRVLDYGFGTAANLIHLARRGFSMTGLEVSASALEIAEKRCATENINANLRLFSGSEIPFEAHTFDAVIAWQVLYYNSWTSFYAAMDEIGRVLRPGGIFIGTLAGVGDVSHRMSKLVGDCEYISGVPGQEGAHLLIVDEEDLPRCFPGQKIRTGEFTYDFDGSKSRHFIVTYQKTE